MPAQPPLPMCFVAMPFGKKAAPGTDKPVIDFDGIYEAINTAVQSQNLECIRADYEVSGGFINRPMYERLIVAEWVIADLTFANPNVSYEVGVRHGAGAGTTLLVCEERYVKNLPFDFRSFRMIPYSVDDTGIITAASAQALAASIADRMQLFRNGELPNDNPIVEVTRLTPGGNVGHEKADIFLHRMRYVSEVGESVADALQLPREQAAKRLAEIQTALFENKDLVRELYSALLSLFLGYRQVKGWQQMVDLYEHFPRDLRETPVALEQLALGLNRMAEEAAKANDEARADVLRRKALRTIESIPAASRTSETFGILGRIHKGHYEAARDAKRKAEAQGALQEAITAYEAGLAADPRDSFPGVNAVTLRLVRGKAEDEARLARILPVVRFAVESAKPPSSPDEQYWREATRLELACAERDWRAADRHSEVLVSLKGPEFNRETTAKNLRLQREARSKETATVRKLNQYLRALLPEAPQEKPPKAPARKAGARAPKKAAARPRKPAARKRR